jgi:hypothetical protein
MNEVLKIEVQAQVQQATAGLKQLQGSLKATEQAAKGTTAAMPKLGQGTNQATFALTNLSRVVQDAPFGFIGIANNIDPLLQSFTALKASTGSTGAALKALAGSLIGGGGLALAVSAVTSAFTFFALRQRTVKKETEETKNETDSYVRKLSEQKLQVESLVRLAQDQTQAENTRVLALKKLNEIIPDSIGKLNQQNIATAEGVNIIRQYVKAIEARATAELLINRIAENNIKLFDNRNNALLNTAKFEQDILDLRAKQERLRQKGQFEAAEQVGLQIQNILKINETAQQQNRKTSQELIDANQRLREEYQRILPEEIKLTKQGKEKTEERKAELAGINGVIIALEESNRLIKEQIDLNNQLKNAGRFELRTGGEGQNEIRQLGGFVDRTQDIQQLAFLAKETKKLNDGLQLSDQLINSIANEFADLFTNLSKDGVKAFEDIAKSIAQTTQRILIQYAVTQALKALFNTLDASGTAGELTDEAKRKLGKGVVRKDDLFLLIGRG